LLYLIFSSFLQNNNQTVSISDQNVGLDLDPNCLHRLPPATPWADKSSDSLQRVKLKFQYKHVRVLWSLNHTHPIPIPLKCICFSLYKNTNLDHMICKCVLMYWHLTQRINGGYCMSGHSICNLLNKISKIDKNKPWPVLINFSKWV